MQDRFFLEDRKEAEHIIKERGIKRLDGRKTGVNLSQDTTALTLYNQNNGENKFEDT